MKKNILYAQSGGVTAVINASACGVVETARRWPDVFGGVFAARDGIAGVLDEALYDLAGETAQAIAGLRHRPGGAFGSCRLDLDPYATHRHEYERVLEVFAAHDIGHFLYNGGGGSMLTATRLAQAAADMGYPLDVIGIPKTIDNDLYDTDTSPGFGSAAKYVAVSTREAACDVASMQATSTKVFILEVMGRNAGWLAAAGGLAERDAGELPLVLLFAERAFDAERFAAAVRERVEHAGYCVVVASEGMRDGQGEYLSVRQKSTVRGWTRLGGVAAQLAELVRMRLGYRTHWAVSDYLQRAARHIASQTDVEQAYAVGRAAVELARQGRSGVMVTLRRLTDEPYGWETGATDLQAIADRERGVPDEFISADGFGITPLARRYLRPLITGEAYPPFRDGVPEYPALRHTLRARRLPQYTPRSGDYYGTVA
ncbi:6-phosphofructokinase [Acidihalobacter ferrooxydans]|uniref:Pyrophosphate--fructose 6-phosphate 1-phosphotransferase n=1 Tax=Acidihalobacter ferrooxydans TaxID=1765967 RepID=A0A1P8UEE7_9GAMM|nr:6-phosphofructokinase [Acidihalobacter ferrooxydans]APZ42200.1 6-phosphofructokinase [Acidihalobacter ferrooxydans]